MCGIAGHFLSSDVDARVLDAMSDALTHRGPDSGGTWTEPSAGLGFVHRRLAIVDLSAAGSQPMTSRTGRFVITFNGEIYNHLDIRRKIERFEADSGLASKWRGHSDTETILRSMELWGIRETVSEAVGMFALAVWDRENRVLTLARDRLGEKPLYYGFQGRSLLFGSELKALCKHPDFQGQVSEPAQTLFLRHGYVPAPYSIYTGILKLVPGCLVTISEKKRDATAEAYWSVASVAERGLSEPFRGGAQEAKKELERLLMQSVSGQLMSDVPLGAFLSGGVDSSAVVAAMQEVSTRQVRTFSIGFTQSKYNEANYAAAVAQHLGTDHTETYVSPEDALAVIPAIPKMFDEPLADSSQIPTFLVSRMARESVTVSLSGDGGDELFGGYHRHQWIRKVWGICRLTPRPVRLALAGALAAVSPHRWDAVGRAAETFLPPGLRFAALGEKLQKLGDLMGAKDPEEVYRRLVSQISSPDAYLKAGRDSPMPGLALPDAVGEAELEERAMYLDLMTYLPDDILAKVDRAAMSVSLETRVPLLDHRIVEFAWSLPLHHKIIGTTGKQVLRDVLYDRVPRALIERPKMGFAMPVAEWLRGPLQSWAEDLISRDRLAREGTLKPEAVWKLWQQHLSGGRDNSAALWNILILQQWARAQRGQYA